MGKGLVFELTRRTARKMQRDKIFRRSARDSYSDGADGIAFGFVALRHESAMQPSVLILESRREVADALADVVSSANYAPVIRSHVERLTDLDVNPAAIIVRIAFEGITEPPHAAIARLPAHRPPVIAIAFAQNEIAEAERLRCDVVLQPPDGVSYLFDALARLVHA